MNVVILGVLGTKVLATAAVLALITGLALLAVALDTWSRKSAGKSPVAQRIELPPAIRCVRGRANTRRLSSIPSRAPPDNDSTQPAPFDSFPRE